MKNVFDYYSPFIIKTIFIINQERVFKEILLESLYENILNELFRIKLVKLILYVFMYLLCLGALIIILVVHLTFCFLIMYKIIVKI